MHLSISHETRYAYQPVAASAWHLLHLEPRDTPCQHVIACALVVDPEPTTRVRALDVYGNPRHFVAIAAPHEGLRVRVRSTVETSAPAPVTSRIGWEDTREHFVYRAGGPWEPATEFTLPSDHVHPGAVFRDYARPSFPPGRPLLEAARELTARIHQDFHYRANSTGIHTPAAEALARREGVCQDFTHVLLACLRSLGLAARYVSGYLLTEPPPGQPRLIGSDASHAWASLWLPDADGPAEARWYDLDPTNDRHGLGTPGEDFVRVAVGRDFADVSPLRGVIQGSEHHALTVSVTVTPGAPEADPAGPSPNSDTPEQ